MELLAEVMAWTFFVIGVACFCIAGYGFAKGFK